MQGSLANGQTRSHSNWELRGSLWWCLCRNLVGLTGTPVAASLTARQKQGSDACPPEKKSGPGAGVFGLRSHQHSGNHCAKHVFHNGAQILLTRVLGEKKGVIERQAR